MRIEKEYVCSAPNCCDTEQRSASQPGSVASGTPGIIKIMGDLFRTSLLFGPNYNCTAFRKFAALKIVSQKMITSRC